MKRVPFLLSLPDIAPPPSTGPLFPPFEIRDKVVSVAIEYPRYYWRRRDTFVDLPQRVAVAARLPDSNLCKVN